jgi:uncharacterized protein YbjT (DUF2867 family)
MKTAVIAGTSGLIGTALLPMLLDNPEYEKVISLGRRTLSIQHPKLQQMVVDFGDLSSFNMPCHDVYCCLGTTIRVAKTKERFFQVDHDYPLELAKAAKRNGADTFGLVSAIASDEHSRLFYSRVKGKLENTLKMVGFKTLIIVRPSMLLGPRKEFRLAEWISKQVMTLFSWIIPARYRAVKDTQVARTLLEHCLQGAAGIHVLENEVILRTKG